MKLMLRPEIARRMVWSKPESRIAPFCSLCQRHIADDEVPMMMWDDKGACVQFCDACQAKAIEVRP